MVTGYFVFVSQQLSEKFVILDISIKYNDF